MTELERLERELDDLIAKRHPRALWDAYSERKYAEGLKARITELKAAHK